MAASRYFLGETLKPENDVLARYYAGETIPPEVDGIDGLGRAIVDGDIEFDVAADELLLAHDRLFGRPGDDILDLAERIDILLAKAMQRAEMREAVASEGGSVARVREDLDPRLADRLGIDMARPLTQSELAHLLAGSRADGMAVPDRQIQRPMRSVVDVFGLDPKVLPDATAVERILAGRRVDGDPPREAKGDRDALSDKVISGARKRFFAAYGLPANTELTANHIDHIKAGRSATGRLLDVDDVLRHLTATKQPISYTDCIWSAGKSVSVAFALAPTEAERALIVQAHRDAVAGSMTYLETHLGFTRKGKSGGVTMEAAVSAWIVCDHYTSRPTAEVAVVDRSGEKHTEFHTIPTKVADPQLHSHALLLNHVITESGRIGAMDLDHMDGLVKLMGRVYQGMLARNLRASGINAELDPKTGAARIADIPEYVSEHFSKRSRDLNVEARNLAFKDGLDWDAMTPAHQIKYLGKGFEKTRNRKLEREGDSDFTIWRNQAKSEIGYCHRSVLRPGQERRLRPAEERHRHAYEVSLPLIEDALARRAKLSASEFREFAASGLVEAGISNDPGRDIKAVMRLYRELGVRQNGEMTRIVFGKDVQLRGKERWSVTTAMHLEEEQAVVNLAQKFANDRSGAVSPYVLEYASRVFLAKHPEIDPTKPQWIKQREVIEQAGTGPMFNVIEGVGGSGKSTMLGVLVIADREQSRDLHGIARSWKQATSLRGAGLVQREVAAASVFLDRVKSGKITLSGNSKIYIEELSQIGCGDMLQLLRLQQRHGFRMLAIGDPKQGGAIEPEVIELLLKTLGDRAPKILTSVRQNTEREREISKLFRDGHANEAIGLKLEDCTAELVAGGREATIQRIAAKWAELTEADPTLKPTIGTITNRDAHDIGVAIRKRLQAIGSVGHDQIELKVLRRGESGAHSMFLASGDRVRVFHRVWADGHFASNGDVLEVLSVSERGMMARNEAGRAASISWEKLRGRFDDAPRMAYGHALTIDASQGTTSRVHIDAILSGSWHQQGGKGYVNESRQVETTYMIVNEAAERKRIYARIPRGEYRPVHAADIWKHVGDNLSRPSAKASALEFLRIGTEIRRGGTSALPVALEQAERREQTGRERMTLRQRLERVTGDRVLDRVSQAVRYVRAFSRDQSQERGLSR